MGGTYLMQEESGAEPASDFLGSVIAARRHSLTEFIELAVRLYADAPGPEHAVLADALNEALAESRRLDLTEAAVRLERAEAFAAGMAVERQAAGAPRPALRAVGG